MGFFGVSEIFPFNPDSITDKTDFGNLCSKENFLIIFAASEKVDLSQKVIPEEIDPILSPITSDTRSEIPVEFIF
jgi:hypothetical protein